MASHRHIAGAQAGDILAGAVSGIEDFGVYVKFLDGEGLIDQTEIAWTPGVPASDLVQVGDDVVVQLLDADVRYGAPRLSLRALAPDPLVEFARTRIAEPVVGTVSRVAPFGVFVDVGDGVAGILTPRLVDTAEDDPQRQLNQGDEVRVRVANINTFKRQISFKLT